VYRPEIPAGSQTTAMPVRSPWGLLSGFVVARSGAKRSWPQKMCSPAADVNERGAILEREIQCDRETI
jgi:hypothetical protein